jgi:hypothetical protein
MYSVSGTARNCSLCSRYRIAHGSCTGTKVYSLKSGLEAEYNVFYFGYSKKQQSVCSTDHGSCTGTKVYSLKSGLEAGYNDFYFRYSKAQQSV